MAIQQVQTTIVSVNANPTSTGRQAWDVTFQDGTTVKAWEPANAQKALAFVNVPSVVTYTETQKGDYTNRSFKDVQPAPMQMPNGNGGPGFPANFNPHTQQALPVGVAMPLPAAQLPVSAPPMAQATPSLRDSLINRQSAAKSATAFLSPLLSAGVPLEEAMTHVRSLIRELEHYILTGELADTPVLVPAGSSDVKAPWED
jgi:hypothetical protein